MAAATVPFSLFRNYWQLVSARAFVAKTNNFNFSKSVLPLQCYRSWLMHNNQEKGPIISRKLSMKTEIIMGVKRKSNITDQRDDVAAIRQEIIC